jgi:two-component system sensor histidine kinase UhpB
MSHLLRPQMLDELGLMPTLRWLARTFGQRTGMAVELSAEGVGDRIDPEMDSLVFRVVQEALTNVAKHARVSSARVRLAVRGHRLHLSIEDQGDGFEAHEAAAAGEGFGLRGMRDRVQLFGGRFTVRSGPGQGTAIEAEVPLGRPEAVP